MELSLGSKIMCLAVFVFYLLGKIPLLEDNLVVTPALYVCCSSVCVCVCVCVFVVVQCVECMCCSLECVVCLCCSSACTYVIT